MPNAPAPRPFLGWRMVALGFLAQNLAIGTTFGSFGVLIKPVATELGASRGATALGIAFILVLMGITGPLLGRALTRYPIRRVMMLGAALMGAGFTLAALSPSFPLFLLGYSIIGGAGCALLGVIPSITLVSNWFSARVGLVIGLVSTPLLVALAPPIASALVSSHGWRGAMFAQAALLLVLLPLLKLVVSRPEDVGQVPYGAASAPAENGTAPPEPAAPAWNNRALLRNAAYWAQLLGAGLATTGGIVIVSHLVSFATDQGIEPGRAAALQSLNGICSMGGALLFGAIADRLGPRLTLGLISLMQAVFWSALVFTPGFAVTLLAVAAIGLFSGAVYPVYSALLGVNYGRESFAGALGLATLLMLPFTFAAAPLAGMVFDHDGSYTRAFATQIGAYLLAAMLFLLVRPARKLRT